MVESGDGLSASRAVRALARVGELSEDHLRAALAHADPEVIKEALACGAALPAAPALSAGLLSHERWDVRVAAARALRTSGTAAELPAVRAALEAEADSMVRAALAEAAAQLASR